MGVGNWLDFLDFDSNIPFVLTCLAFFHFSETFLVIVLWKPTRTTCSSCDHPRCLNDKVDGRQHHFISVEYPPLSSKVWEGYRFRKALRSPLGKSANLAKEPANHVYFVVNATSTHPSISRTGLPHNSLGKRANLENERYRGLSQWQGHQSQR
jgi:hypothetical protein